MTDVRSHSAQPLKPQYTLKQFDEMDYAELELRLAMIDNRQAMELAGDILNLCWNNVAPAMKLWSHLREKAEKWIPDGNAHKLRRRFPLRVICGSGRRRAITVLNDLSRVSLAQLAAEPGAGLQQIESRVSPLWRTILPSARLGRRQAVSAFLAAYLEFLYQPRRTVPWLIYLVIAIIPTAILINLPIFLSIPFRFGWAGIFAHLVWTIAVLSYITWLSSYNLQRLLALYISFTDEFVESKEEERH